MTGLLISSDVLERFEDDIRAIAKEAGIGIEPILLPADPASRLPDDEVTRIEIAYFSGDIFPSRSRSFFAAAQGADSLRWMHVFNAGVDNPVFSRLLDRGVRITTSSGSTAEPIAQTAIGGMLMLARGFVPHFRDAQQRHAWEQLPYTPPDLHRQEMTIIGLGAIGNAIARIAKGIGMTVIGVRRSAWREGDHADRVITPAELPTRLHETDWLVIACPLTEETRGLVSRELLESLPHGAHVINIARGEIVDEEALADLLQSGHLGGAYLDVFHEEPLPSDAPFWDMPNVIVTPHNSSPSQGNNERAAMMFLDNLRRWTSEEPLVNEVRR